MGLDAEQLANARIVVAESATAASRVAGWLPRSLAIALCANAWAESRLLNSATGGAGEIGLFQCSPGGAGRGWSTAQLRDPRVNARIILAECLMADRSRNGVISAAFRGTVGDLAAAICIHAERPANAQTRAAERRRYVALFGVSPETSCGAVG